MFYALERIYHRQQLAFVHYSFYYEACDCGRIELRPTCPLCGHVN